MTRPSSRERLYQAAVELIGEHGYTATSVDQIAERAGVAKGTVYYNFASKAALFESLLTDRVGELVARLDRAAAGYDPAAAVDSMILAGLEYVAANQSLARLFLGQMWRRDAEWHPTAARLRAQLLTTIATPVEAGVRTGLLRPDLDARTAATALFGACLLVALDWLENSPERSLAEVHQSVVSLLGGRVLGTA